MISVCKSRRADYERRWRDQGSYLGMEERLFKVSHTNINPTPTPEIRPTLVPRSLSVTSLSLSQELALAQKLSNTNMARSWNDVVVSPECRPSVGAMDAPNMRHQRRSSANRC